MGRLSVPEPGNPRLRSVFCLCSPHSLPCFTEQVAHLVPTLYRLRCLSGLALSSFSYEPIILSHITAVSVVLLCRMWSFSGQIRVSASVDKSCLATVDFLCNMPGFVSRTGFMCNPKFVTSYPQFLGKLSTPVRCQAGPSVCTEILAFLAREVSASSAW